MAVQWQHLAATICRVSTRGPGATRPRQAAAYNCACRLETRRKQSTLAPKLRNFGIIAHIDAGKTTLTEKMLLLTGYTPQAGNVDDGTTVTDFLKSERERGITIQSACVPLTWRSMRLNLIDTPGHVDFTMEVERSLRVLDGAVCVLDGVAGVEAQTETVWRQANRHAVPRIALVNKMDREGSNARRAVQSMRERLSGCGEPLLVHWPVLQSEGGFPNPDGRGGRGFRGLVDLVTLDAVAADDLGSAKMSLDEARAIAGPTLDAEVAAARVALVEQLADIDDSVLDELVAADMDHSEIKAPLLTAALRRATISRRAVPVLLGSAFRTTGVAALLDAVGAYLPSPDNVSPPRIVTEPLSNAQLSTGNAAAGAKDAFTTDTLAVASAKSPIGRELAPKSTQLVALAFKVIHDARRAPVVFFRVYSGELTPKLTVVNARDMRKERVHRLVQIRADAFTDVPRATAGDIVAAYGLSATQTGDTILDVHTAKRERFHLEPIPVPPPVFMCAVEPESRRDVAALEQALQMLRLEDPSLRTSTVEETEQLLASGMGELHLQITQERLAQLGVRCRFGPVKISYRETVDFSGVDSVESVLCDTLVADQPIDGKQVHVGVTLELRRLQIADGGDPDANAVEIAVNSGQILQLPNGETGPLAAGFPALPELLAALAEGLRDALNHVGGPQLRAPLAQLALRVTRLKLWRSDACPSPAMLRGPIARRIVKRLLRLAAGPLDEGDHVRSPAALAVLEPVMRVAVSIPATALGAVTQDLVGHRRGAILDVASESDLATVDARVPLAELLGYATFLRSASGGAGSFVMHFDGYANVAPAIVSGLVGPSEALPLKSS